ncbi:MAG: hypothetical protein HPY76_09490 [Anaerolineae bacterium]|nr:hypothetical protein [Anaerolineae bacterium]
MQSQTSFLAPKKWMLTLYLLVFFALGAVIRFYDLTDLPLDFHSTRQMRAAIIARGMYYQTKTDVPDWQREMAVAQWQSESLIEPPIMEWLTATTYRVIGREALWVARVYSNLFWLVGGVFVYLLAKELAGVDGGLIALAYFLFLPYGAIASRSFQPDPLMTAMLAAALWSMVRWHKSRTWGWALTAGLMGGLTILVKAVAVFFVGAAWLGLVLAAPGLRQALRDRRVWLLAALTLLPYAMFHIYGVYIDGELASQYNQRFFPQLWFDPVHYLQWKGVIAGTVGLEWFLVALISIFLLPEKPLRALLASAWTGYFLYGMFFSYHIVTHDYYQLPLVPLVALGLGIGASFIFAHLRGRRALLYPLVVGALSFVIITQAWDVRVQLKRDDYRPEAAYWRQLGQTLGQGARVVGLTHDYGYRLAYWGWVDSRNWMTSGDFNLQALSGGEMDMEAAFDEAIAGNDYFVVTLRGELERQPKLQALLDRRYPLLATESDALIYDLRHPKE